MFDEVKRSGFLGNFIKGQKHKAVGEFLDSDKEFQDLNEVREMYVKDEKDSDLAGAAKHQPQPFELLRQIFAAEGDNRNAFKYPTPRLIESKSSEHSSSA